MTDRPNPSFKLTGFDKTLEILGWSGLAALWIIAGYCYFTLPEIIPVHFNATGAPDRYGSKEMLFLFPILGTFIVVGFSVLNLFPQLFNYPVSITEDNAQQQYLAATRMMRFIKLVIVVLFLSIVLLTNTTVLGKTQGLSTWFLPVTLGLILLPVGIFMGQVWKTKKDKQ